MWQGLLLAVLLAVGCQGPAKKPSPAAGRQPTRNAPISNTDPCAMRLHDMCGPLLLYYATHHSLPPRIEELSAVPGFESIREFLCPVSKKPYLYNPVGIVTPNTPSRIILYDAAPSHSTMRWAIAIIEPSDDSALIAKVIVLPESYFSIDIKVPGK